MPNKMFLLKNNASFGRGRYFFMVITKSNKRIIKNMYSFSISNHLPKRDDDITAQLLHCFQTCLLPEIPTKLLYHIIQNL